MRTAVIQAEPGDVYLIASGPVRIPPIPPRTAVAAGEPDGERIFNVRDYGAIGDGAADDTAAVQAAADAAAHWISDGA